jgi:hypothetical protein
LLLIRVARPGGKFLGRVRVHPVDDEKSREVFVPLEPENGAFSFSCLHYQWLIFLPNRYPQPQHRRRGPYPRCFHLPSRRVLHLPQLVLYQLDRRRLYQGAHSPWQGYLVDSSH